MEHPVVQAVSPRRRRLHVLPAGVEPPAIRAVALGFAPLAALGFAGGGYEETAWRWAAIGFLAAAAFGVLRGGLRLGRIQLVCVSAATAVTIWMFVSDVWGIPGTEAARESQRAVLYVAALAAFLAVVTRGSIRAFLAGVLLAATSLAGYALADRAVHGPGQDPFEGRLLFEPVGYANALGIVCAIGLVIAVGLCVVERRGPIVALGGVAGAVLVLALALTSSRGAWLATACGLTVVVLVRVCASRRLGLVPVLVPFALVACVLAIPTLTPYRSSIGDRAAYWSAAVADVREHPLLGSGAGSFDDYWYAHRSAETSVRDAHSLYLESLAELGPLGLLLVLALLAPPLVALARPEVDREVAIAGGAYVAFLVHAGLDWDWEMPVTTVAGLACGAALLVAARPASGRPRAREA